MRSSATGMVVSKRNVEKGINLAVVVTLLVVTGCMEIASEVVLVPIGEVEMEVISEETDASALVLVVEVSNKIPLVLIKGIFPDISFSLAVAGLGVINEGVAISIEMVVSTGVVETKVVSGRVGGSGVVANGIVETDPV